MFKCCSVKYCFFFFNMLFLASGVALITIGALQYTTYSQIGTFTGSSLSKIALVLIAVGATIVLISLLGHLGSFTNNTSVVACFICLLLVIILMEILTGAAFYVFRSKMTVAITTNAREAVHDYRQEKRHAINRIQDKFRCCGADSYTDWSSSVGWENHDAVPDSCCVVKSDGCGQDKEKVHQKGCIWPLKFFLLKNLVWVGAVCIALGVAEAFGVIAGVCLFLDIKRKSYNNLS